MRLSLHDYIDGIKTGGQVLEDVQEIPLRERAGEYLMTRLRTITGISGSEYEKRFLLPFAPIEASLENCRPRWVPLPQILRISAW